MRALQLLSKISFHTLSSVYSLLIYFIGKSMFLQPVKLITTLMGIYSTARIQIFSDVNFTDNCKLMVYL